MMARKIEISDYLMGNDQSPRKHVSEVDVMSDEYLLSFDRRIERRWAERINSLRQIRSQIVVATGRIFQRAFDDEGSLIPVPVRPVVGQRQLDRSRSHD
jgi:hypothetical protein